MSFRKAAILVAAWQLSPAPALAQEPRQVEVGYEITFAGFAGFRIDLTARFNGTRYDVETRTFKEGLLKALTINYHGRNRAWGGFAPGGAQPAAGSLSIVVGDKPRTWLAEYGSGGAMRETHNPGWQPTPSQTISDTDRQGSLDPLSAALAIGMAGDAACDKTVRSNDGKRVIDVLLHKVGTEPAAASGIPNARGDVLVCEVYSKRIAGEFAEAPKEAETERERPIKLWFAYLDASSIRYPAKMEAQTSFGTIRGRLMWFRERPLSTEEAQSVGR